MQKYVHISLTMKDYNLWGKTTQNLEIRIKISIGLKDEGGGGRRRVGVKSERGWEGEREERKSS